MKRLVYSLLILSVLSSCSGEEEDAELGVAKFIPTGSITLNNDEIEEIFYFVVERRTASLILWAPTVGDSTPSIPAESSVEVKIADILGIQEDSEEVIFYWWTRDYALDVTSSSGKIESQVIVL